MENPKTGCARHIHQSASHTLTDEIPKLGGVLLFSDAVTDIYNTSKLSYPLALIDGTHDDTDRSWFARWLFEVTQRWTSKAQKNTEGDKLHLLLQEHGGFELLGQQDYYSPLNWDGGDPVAIPNGREVGRLMLLNITVSTHTPAHPSVSNVASKDFLQSSRPSLLASGLAEDVVGEWAEQVKEEIFTAQKHMFMKWTINWASKR